MSTTSSSTLNTAPTSTSLPSASSSPSPSSPSAPTDPLLTSLTSSSTPSTKYTKRKQVEYQGRIIYEWEQDLEEVNMFITPPSGLPAKMIEIQFTEKHLKVGIKGAERLYIDEDLGGLILTKESYWTLEDGVIHLQFQKGLIGETWSYCTSGQKPLDAVTVQKDQQQILLERFQREHPGFDFSQANFSGQAPDARSFMGGFDQTKIRR